MKKILKFAAFAGIGLALFFVILLFAFYYLIETGEFRRLLVSELEKQTQMRLSIGETEVKLGWVTGVSFRDFALFRSEHPHPVVRAPKVLVRVALTPLLGRKIVFREVRFYQPMFQLGAGQGDQSSVQSLMAHLLFQKQGDARFALDLQRIRIEKGEATFPDPLKREKESGVARFREMDITLERVLSKPGSTAPSKTLEEKPGVQFSVSATVVKDGMTARLKSKGKVLFPDESFDLRKAWFDVDTSLRDTPSEMLRDAYALPVKRLQGSFSFDLSSQGSFARAVHAKGRIDFKDLRIEAPELFPDSIAPGEGNLKLAIDWTRGELRFSRLDLRSGEVELTAQGFIRTSGDTDPYLEMEVTTPLLPLHVVRRYVPWKALPLSQWEDWAETITDGEIKLTRAGVSGRFSEMKFLLKPEFGGRIWLETEIHNAGGDLEGDRYLPLRNVNGRIVLENGDLSYKFAKGRYGQSRIEKVEGSHKRIFSDQATLELRAKGEADFGELKGQLESPFVPERLAEAASEVRELGGKGRFDISLRKQAASPYRLDGMVALENGGVRTDKLSLTQIQGKITVSPRAISSDAVTALLEGSPLRFKGVLNRYFSEQGSFDVTIESPGVKAGPIMRFFPDSEVVSDAGMVGGMIRYRGSIASKDDRTLTGSLQLRGVQLPMKLFDQTVDQVDGEVSLGDSEIHFREIKGRVIESAFDFSGRWSFSEQPQLTFTFNSPELDLGRLLSENDTSPDELYDRLQASGKVNIAKGQYEGFEFSELKTDLSLDKRQWRLDNFFARSGAGTVQGVASFMDKPETLEFSMEPKIQGVPIREFLSLFDIGRREITGNVDLTGKLESTGANRSERKRNLSGHFHLEIKDGVARRLRLLVRILNLMDLTRWFSLQLPDLNQKGIRFRSITGDFKVEKGVYSTQNFLVDSDDISITGAGNFDGPNETIDAVVALRPFPRVGSAVSYIPLIGPGIAGIKDSIMVASFSVKGPAESATITPAPLSTLSEFFFSALKIPQKIITVPGTGKQ